MANRLIELYNQSKFCKGKATFSELPEYDFCIRTLNEFKRETPNDNDLYKEIVDASELSVQRIKIQKELQYKSFSREEEFLKLRTHRQVVRGKEIEAWDRLDASRAERIEKNIDKPNVFLNQENASNLTLIIILFMIFFVYRMIASSGFKKIKTRNILQSFQLDHLALLVDKDAFTRKNYNITRFGTKIKDEVKPEDVLSEVDRVKLELIYQHIDILGQAMQADMKINKFNLFVGVDLSLEKNRLALNKFLELINEKTLIKDN